MAKLLAGLLVSIGLIACGSDGTTQPISHEGEPVASLEVTSTTLHLSVGEQATLSATAMCEHQVVIHPTISWSSGDGQVATVAADGTVEAVAYGNTTVTATAGSVVAHADVNVAPQGTVVGASGGTVGSLDGVLTLEFPAGALDGPTDVIVEKLDDASFAADPLYVVGTAYAVQPEGLQLQERARLRIRFQEEHVPAGVPQERLRIQEQEQQRWRETEQNQLQSQERTVEAQVQRLGVFGIVPSHAAMVGPEGGTVTSADGRASVQIPAGALATVQYVALHRLGDAAYDGDPNYVRGTAYEITPLGQQLQLQAQLRIQYDPTQVPAGVLQERLRIQERDQAQNRWQEAQQNQLHLAEHAVEARLDGFGVFAVVAGTEDQAGPSGGTAVSADGVVKLEIPAGALDGETAISIVKVADATFADDPLYVAGTAYDISPDGLEFNEPVHLEITYNPANVPDGVALERLRIQQRDEQGQTWQATQQHRLRQQDHVVEADIQHLSTYAVRGQNPADLPTVSITLDPPSMSLGVGQTADFTAAAYDENGLPLDHPTFSWSTNASGIATVSSSGQGKSSATGSVTGVAAGTATITVTSGGVSASATVQVSSIQPPPPPPPPPGTVATVTVTPSAVYVGLGGTAQLTAVARDADGNVVSRTFSWTSSSTSIASVSGSGLVTGVSEGTATITATTGGVSGTATATVGSPVTSVVIDRSGNEPVEIGLTMQLSATAYDPQGLVVDATFEWSSSDESIVTVDQTGLVTGVSVGTATITAAVGGVSDATDIKVVGESGTYGNNLSWPVVFADGVGITGSPVSTDPGLRPLDAEGVTVDALPFFWEGNAPTYGIYFEQMTFNTWQAEWVDGSGQPTYDATITWGDNLTHQTWSASRPIRVEETLYADGMTLLGYNMFLLYGSGQTEMQGTDGTTAEFTPTVYTAGPSLKVVKLNGEGGSPVATVTDQVVGSEVNVAGKVIYGYNLRLSDWTPPAGVSLDGWYRITFTLATAGNVNLTAVGNTAEGEDLAYVPEVSPSGRYSWIDIYVEP